MTNIDTLKRCKANYEYYTPFLDKCITLLQFENNKGLSVDIKRKIDDIISMSKLIEHFWEDESQKFSTGVLEVLVAYRRKLRLE